MYPHQVDRLSDALRRAGVDAFVATSSANVAYITGFRSFSRAVDPTVDLAAVLVAGRTALIVPAADADAVEAAGVEADYLARYGVPVADFVADADTSSSPTPAGDSPASFADAVVGALDALGIHTATLGIDESGLGSDGFPLLTARLAPRVAVRAAESLAWARSVKSPYEIECLQRSLGVAEESVNVVLQMLKPGVTEREALAAFETEVVRRGAAPAPSSIGFGPGSAVPAWASDRTLRVRDLVRFDLACVYKGYHAVLVRTAVMGMPDERQDRVHAALLAGVEAAIDAVKPGVSTRTVLEAGLAAARSSGLERYSRTRIGCGIGLERSEWPKLGLDSPEPLEPGMVLCLETPYFEPRWGGLGMAETVLVTQGGAHTLNRSHRGLIVLD
jgi:Xaa-Pro aminopeptidase